MKIIIKKLFFEGNVLIILVCRIFLIMFLLMLSRIGFLVFNASMFPGISFHEIINVLKGGIVFDLSAVVYFNALIIVLHIIPFNIRYNTLYQHIIKYIYFLLNGLALAMNGADYVYFRFLNKRATADIFGTFENEEGLAKMFFRFLFDYWPATLYTLLLMGLMVVLYRLARPKKPQPRNRLISFSLNLAAVPLILALVVGAARGGFKHSTRPITISNAARYVDDPRLVPAVLNTPFSILRTFGMKELERYRFFDEEKLKTIYDPHYKPRPTKQFDSLNVVIIILESFSREYIGFFNKDLENGTYKGFTPFLDSLLAEGLTFEVSLSNGNKSIDAMPSILASMPSLETPYIISHYANNKINGLPSLLKSKGYYSAFFHGAPNGSMGFDSFSRMAGFDKYFGMNEYEGEGGFDGMWGLYDEPFMEFFLKKIGEFPQPFLAAVFTLSSHHPFEVPAKYKGRFPEGPIPICETIGYTDHVLRKFFRDAESEPWFSNTLFVITADHTNEKIHREYQNSYGQFSIPILFYGKKSRLKGTLPKIAQQIDIMPSILSYLNYDMEYIAFGNNLFDDTKESFGFNTFGNTYYLFMRDHVLEMIANSTSAVYNFKTDRMQEDNLVGKLPGLQADMEDKIRAIMQTYNQRLLDNDLIVR